MVHGFYSLAYNSKIIQEPPTGWSILWDPQYEGRYSVNLDYYELNVYIAVLALGERKEDIFITIQSRARYLRSACIILPKWQGGSGAATIAELWINFLLEPENQLSIFANQLGTCPVTVEAWDIYTRQVLNTSERKRLFRLFNNIIPWQILETRDRNAFHLLRQEALGGRLKHLSTLDN